jgi:hypothetical protein
MPDLAFERRCRSNRPPYANATTLDPINNRFYEDTSWQITSRIIQV